MPIQYIVDDDYYVVLDPDGNEIGRGSKKDKRYVEIVEHGVPGEYRIVQPEVKVGLVAGSKPPSIDPPNLPPSWTATPNPNGIAGVGFTYALANNAFDPESDALTFVLSVGAWPANVSMDAAGLITATSAIVEGTTTGLVVTIDDGTNAPVASAAFSLVVSAAGNILWSGQVEDGSFDEWHFNEDETQVQFPLVPSYGRPPDYGSGGTGAGSANQTQSGDGSLLDIVDAAGAGGYDVGPTRVGNRCIRFTLKNSVNGSEPNDCHLGSDCSIRRSTISDTKFTVDTDLAVGILPNNTERWISLSIYLESDFPIINQESGFMTMFGIKAGNSVGSAAYSAPVRGWLGLTISNGWVFRDTWISDAMKNGQNPPQTTNQDYRYAFYYGPNGCNDSDQDIHYSDGANSRALMADLNLGGWTDFIWHFKPDTTTEVVGNNTGYVDIYMRHNSNPWAQVLAIRPFNVDFEGLSYGKGLGVSGGYYTNFAHGPYCSVFRVWGAANNAVCYADNFKPGDENATFEQMTPDGSSL